MIYEVRKLSQLTLWEDNPRAIDEVDLERLKSLITKLGLFKTFVVTKDGTILGGNQRYKACKDLGIEDVPCSIVKADTLEEKLDYALADNDRAGYYVEEKIRELVLKAPNLDLKLYSLDIGKPASLEFVINNNEDFELKEKNESDELKTKDKVTCPSCGLEFTP